MPTERLLTAALTIAGSDSCGGAGIQADLKTFAAFGVHGASVITAITAQNTLGVQAAMPVDEAMVIRQLTSVLEDLPVGAIKTGMMGSAASIGAVSSLLSSRKNHPPLVMDPVMIATSGAQLADASTIDAMRKLMAIASLVTPNLDEAAALSGVRINGVDDMRRAAAELVRTGCGAVLIKGGHLPGPEACDFLYARGSERVWARPMLPGRYHGTGCTLASAVAAGLALNDDLENSTDRAIRFVQKAMQRGRLPLSGELVLLQHDALD